MKENYAISSLLLPLLLVIANGAHAQCFRSVDNPEPVRFTASQSGAPIGGSFSRYQGSLCLPDEHSPGSAKVDIETASIDMGLSEFNTEMRGELFFDSARWPTASFTADQITSAGESDYHIAGTLTIRDISRPLTTLVRVSKQQDSLQLSGEITLSRLAFDLGTGEWSDTRWVGDEVTITLDNKLVALP